MSNTKYSGVLGFAYTYEPDPVNRPSIWETYIEERKVKGNILRASFRNEANDQVNDNVVISNQISVIAAPYVLKNMAHIVYATYLGIKWKVTNISVDSPRLTLTLGGVWNEQQ